MKELSCDRRIKELGKAGDLRFSLRLNTGNRACVNAEDGKAGAANPISGQNSKCHRGKNGAN